MLQAAAFAESKGAGRSLIAAALLHDIGHFLHPDSETAIADGRDFEHEALGAAWLSRAFDQDVTAPIALHVQAKRYLCAVEAGYWDGLSDASRLSLTLQGGVMSDDEAAAFARRPAFEAAILLRRCDDLGKDVDMNTWTIEDYRPLLMACLR